MSQATLRGLKPSGHDFTRLELGGEKNRQYTPRNPEQQAAVQACLDPDLPFVFLEGLEGCGKTLLAMACAMAMMEDRRFGIQRVDIFRAAITDESENIGFLPGTEEDKIRPFIEPMAEALVDLGFHLETENPKISLLDELRRLKVYFRSTGFMRGRNLYNSAVVIDEAQNLTYRQLRKLLTRVVNRPVGHSKVILCGSLEQIDLPKKWPSGLKYWMDVAQEEWGTNAVHRLPKTMRGDGVERLLARASQMPYQAA